MGLESSFHFHKQELMVINLLGVSEGVLEKTQLSKL